MLYDPKWAGVSLDGFIGWLETKDPREAYPFYECEGHCLLGQYMEAMNIEWRDAPTYPGGNWDNSSYAETARKIFGKDALFTVLSTKPYTFGAALERARKFARR